MASLRVLSAILGLLASACAGATSGSARRVAPAASASGPGAVTRVSPYARELSLVGRIDARDPAGPRFGWSGTQIGVAFRGRSIRVELRDLPLPPGWDDKGPNRYRVVLDDGTAEERFTGKDRRLVYEASGLSPAPHRLTLYKQTEAVVGSSQLTSIEIGAPGELLPIAPSGRRVEFIGDSLTTAYGDEGKSEACHYSPDTQNHWLSFDAVAARSLGADAHVIAWSGKGASRNYANAREPLIAEVWRRNLPGDPGAAWDVRAWVPDAVVIDIGGNDFWDSDPTEAAYVAAYRALVDEVRRAYPRAHVFCVAGPASDDWPPHTKTLTLWRTYQSRVVDAYHAAGDARVHYLELGPITKEEPRGCDSHAGLATHARLARELEAGLRAVLGW